MLGPRRLVVIPVGLLIGWELALAAGTKETVVVVREVKSTASGEVLVVSQPNGAVEEIEVIREDNADNKTELQGSELAANDTSTPATEEDIEEEVDE
jgi:hypothetical protein